MKMCSAVKIKRAAGCTTYGVGTRYTIGLYYTGRAVGILFWWGGHYCRLLKMAKITFFALCWAKYWWGGCPSCPTHNAITNVQI